MDIIFQSTFPRGERQQTSLSMHLLTISIHVPAWGTTGSCPLSEYRQRYFNPRSRVGNDANELSKLIRISISIHVPAWGTTGPVGCDRFSKAFQSTFPRGERLQRPFCSLNTCTFQSTFPRGERPAYVPWNTSPPEFQSTFPRGERLGK